MNLLYLITGMFNSAGMERTVANKANYFVGRGHNVTIVTTDQKSRKYFYKVSNSVKKIDLNLNFSDFDRYNIIFRTIVFLYKNYLFKKRLNKLLQRSHYDVVVTLIMKSTDFLYKINDGSVKIVEHHFSREYYKLQHPTFMTSWLAIMAYKLRDYKVISNLKHFDCFVVLTNEDALEWRKKLNNVRVIYNSIEYDKKISANLQNKLVVSIGRLEYQKGYDLLIPIWKKVAMKHPDWQLYIYGSGSQKSRLKQLIYELGLENSIFIKSPISDIKSVILNSSIYVLPSRFEGLPMVLLEAMSLGCPPVAFQCKCGPKDIIYDGVNGLLVNCFDLNRFSDCINYLIENPSCRLKLGYESKKRMESFSHELIGEKWLTLFNELLCGK